MTERTTRAGRTRRREPPPPPAETVAATEGAEPGAEPIVLAERITVIAEAPLAAETGRDPDIGGFAAEAAPTPAERRWRMIAERAYELASERGFEPGRELEDWLRAESEVDSRLAGGA